MLGGWGGRLRGPKHRTCGLSCPLAVQSGLFLGHQQAAAGLSNCLGTVCFGLEKGHPRLCPRSLSTDRPGQELGWDDHSVLPPDAAHQGYFSGAQGPIWGEGKKKKGKTKVWGWPVAAPSRVPWRWFWAGSVFREHGRVSLGTCPPRSLAASPSVLETRAGPSLSPRSLPLRCLRQRDWSLADWLRLWLPLQPHCHVAAYGQQRVWVGKGVGEEPRGLP